MVLLERRFWEPADPSLPTNPNEEMWILESTGEVFGEYSDYLKALYLTKSRVWSSVYTGVSNLTYQEALLEDERGRALARKVRPLYACHCRKYFHQHLYSKVAPLFLSRSSRRSWRRKHCSTFTSVRCVWMISSRLDRTL